MAVSSRLGDIEKRLTTGELSKEELKRYVKFVEPLSEFRLHDVLVRGIPWPDGIRVRLELKPDQVAEFSSRLSTLKESAIRGWWVFPKGIPFPDIFHVEVDIGRPNIVQGGGIGVR